MKYLKTFDEFIKKLKEEEKQKQALRQKDRFQKLSGQTEEQELKDVYAIQLIFERPEDLLLLEHEQYKQFKKTKNRYTFHPANPDIPVMGHYHVVPPNSKKELYAVNVDDGSAHHKKNRGKIVPKKEADELRKMGVKLPDNNILESLQQTLNESSCQEFFSCFVTIHPD